MRILVTMGDVLSGPLSSLSWQHADLVDSNRSGFKRVRFEDGTIGSMQTDGSLQRKSGDPDGAYEQCLVKGDKLVYPSVEIPNGAKTPHVAAFVEAE